MTIAIKLSDSRLAKSHPLGTPLQVSAVTLNRLWWHTKALVPIIGILFLVLGSLVFIHLHWLSQNLLKVPAKGSAKNAEWTN